MKSNEVYEKEELKNPVYPANLFKYIVITVLGLWLVAFVLIPNLMVFTASFFMRDESSLISFNFTISNYRALLNPIYLKVFINSMFYALLTTLICIIMAFPFAYILSIMKNGKNLILLLVIIPFWTSALIRTYAIKILITTWGVINILLLKVGIISEPLNMLYTPGAVIMGLVYTLLPFMILPLYAALEKLDKKLIEAAHDLGAGKCETLTRIVLPLAAPGLAAGSLLVFLPALGLFYIPDVLGGGKDLMIGNLVKNQFMDARDWPFGAAVSVGLTIIMAVLLLINYRTFKTASKRGFYS